jgi:Cellulase (glycosyl hydrolase family 5)
VGVNMRGYYTNIPQERELKIPIPPNYYDQSFKTLSQAGVDFVRYLFFWESYERDPFSFISELQTVAQTADKWGIKLLYANDQYHTSSWLEPKSATGFPVSLFKDNPSYPYGTGGAPGPKDVTAKKWWEDWLNRSVKDANGLDGWTLQAEFLKKIVNTVDKHKSTLGYEILNEPHIRSVDQWEKVGNYNSFMTDQLRTATQKTIFYDRQVPADLYGPVGATPENMAKMAPANKDNVVFKATLYGVPYPKSFAEDRLNAYVKAAQLAGVPLCMCEFNMKPYKQYPEADIQPNQTLVNLFVDKFEEVNAWGWAYWLWNFRPHTNPNFNLISVAKDESIQPTQNFNYIKNTISSLKKQDAGESSDTPTSLAGKDTAISASDSITSLSSMTPSPVPSQTVSSINQGSQSDSIYPTVNITTVSIAGNTKNSVIVTGQAFDVGTDIKEVGVRVDGGRFEPAKSDNEKGWLLWRATVPVETLKDGEHEVVARATDNANQTKRETVTFNIQ